jgi:hypothetical protein
MKESKDLALAHVAASPAEAELVRAILEAEGMFAFIPDSNAPYPVADLTPLDGEYIPTGCQVFVAAMNVARAKEILAQRRELGKSESEESGWLEDEAPDEGEP